jgi:type II secretory pathway component GspD/PulD (secretin)
VLTGETPLNFTLRTLESEGVLNIVNGPLVTVENGETADFEIGRRLNQISTNTDQGQNLTTNIGGEFRQVSLSISPQITQLGEIRLDIQDLELQDFGTEIAPGGQVTVVDITQNGQADPEDLRGIPVSFPHQAFETRRRNLTTVVRVHDGGTIVLGGWTGERTRTNDSGLPILRNIPYIGKLLFARTSDRVDRTNLMIFLTCHVVKP